MLGSALLALATVTLAAVGVLLYTSRGRAWLCAEANARVSATMMGRLQIERIDAIDWPTVTAHGVKLVAPDGVPAIDVEHAVVDLDTGALLEGRFAFERAEVRGGIVRVTEDARGRVNMEETFRGRPDGKDTEEPPSTTPAVEPDFRTGLLDLRSIATSDMTLVIHGGSLPDLRLTHIQGIMRVQVAREGDVYLTFEHYRGDVVRGLPSGTLRFRNVRGYVQAARKRLLYFRGAGESEGEPVEFSVDVQSKPKVWAEIHARFESASAESLTTSAFAATTRLSKHVALHVEHGPPDRPLSSERMNP